MWVQESFLDEGFILDKRIGVGQPKRIENAKILVANTAMDTDKIKIYGARVRVDSMAKVCSLDWPSDYVNGLSIWVGSQNASREHACSLLICKACDLIRPLNCRAVLPPSNQG